MIKTATPDCLQPLQCHCCHCHYCQYCMSLLLLQVLLHFDILSRERLACDSWVNVTSPTKLVKQEWERLACDSYQSVSPLPTGVSSCSYATAGRAARCWSTIWEVWNRQHLLGTMLSEMRSWHWPVPRLVVPSWSCFCSISIPDRWNVIVPGL